MYHTNYQFSYGNYFFRLLISGSKLFFILINLLEIEALNMKQQQRHVGIMSADITLCTINYQKEYYLAINEEHFFKHLSVLFLLHCYIYFGIRKRVKKTESQVLMLYKLGSVFITCGVY